MAMQQQQWQRMPDGRYQNLSTFQIVNPNDLTPDQRKAWGVPSEAAAQPNTTQASQPQAATTPVSGGGNPTTIVDLIRKLYAGNTETDPYKGVVNQAFKNNYSQPGDAPDRSNVTHQLVTGLASTFADRVFQKTGRLPTEDQVKQYVAQSANSSNAVKYIGESLNQDQMNAQADEYLRGNPDALVTPGSKSPAEERLSGLTAQFDKVYNAGRENLVSGYDTTVYNPAKTRAGNDLSGQGMLTNPNSRYTLDAIESNRSRDLASGLNTLESNRASGNIDLSKTIEDILQKNADRSQNAYQFNKTFNANQDNTAFNQGLQRQQLDVAGQIGREQANAGKKSWTDYLNTALSAAGTAAAAYTAFCWVAEELYGQGEKTESIRSYLLDRLNEDSPVGRFVGLYSKFGKEWADDIKRDDSLRQSFKGLYDSFYQASKENQTNG